MITSQNDQWVGNALYFYWSLLSPMLAPILMSFIAFGIHPRGKLPRITLWFESVVLGVGAWFLSSSLTELIMRILDSLTDIGGAVPPRLTLQIGFLFLFAVALLYLRVTKRWHPQQ